MASEGHLTVQNIAGIVARPGDDLSVVTARVRNWTKEGFLQTVGERNPGTGRPKLYSPHAAAHALILGALTDIGIQAAKSRAFDAAFQLAKHAAAEIEEQERANNFVYLVIASDFGGSSGASGNTMAMLRYEPAVEREHDGAKQLVHTGYVQTVPSAEISLVINLTMLFKRLRRKES